MRFIKFLETINLYEGSKGRYLKMFEPLFPLFQKIGKDYEFKSYVNSEIGWAVRVLQKDDRVVWYLRLVKLNILKNQIETETSGPEFQQAYQNYIESLRKKYPGDINHMINQSEVVTQKGMSRPTLKQFMEHMMSLESYEIQNISFGWKLPASLMSELNRLEEDWTERRRREIDYDQSAIDAGEIEIVIQFNDGSQWINLKQSYCDTEAMAMGHCGNKASYDENDTILSYRTTIEQKGRKVWVPHLTFILNQKTGMLGEMKGRGNMKPSSKYHPQIVALLKHPMIKGIIGGGYAPEDNFFIMDLSDELREELDDIGKPGLQTLTFLLARYGFNDTFFDILSEKMYALYFNPERINKDTKEFDTERHASIRFFLESQRLYKALNLYEYVVGERNLNIEPYSVSSTSDLLYHFPSSDINKLGNFIKENHKDEVKSYEKEYGEFDPTNDRDIINIIDEYIPDIQNEVSSAMINGMESGTLSNMNKRLTEYLDSIETDADKTLRLQYEDYHTGPVKLMISLKDLIPLIDEGWNAEMFYNSDYKSLQDLQEEQDYDGFDLDSAIEYFKSGLGL
jgi:hypothetical protein